MSIWSKFSENLRIVLRMSPNPDNYPKDEIFNYPFIKNKKGYIWIGSKNDREAYIRMKIAERGGGSRESLKDKMLEEAIASGEFIPQFKKQNDKKPTF